MVDVVTNDGPAKVIEIDKGTVTIAEPLTNLTVHDDKLTLEIIEQPIQIVVPPEVIVEIPDSAIQVVDAAVQGPMGLQGPIGNTGPQGPQGPQGGAGSYEIWDQQVSAAVWHVTHSLSKHPSVTVVNSIDEVIMAQIDYLSNSAFDVHFAGAISGKVYMS